MIIQLIQGLFVLSYLAFSWFCVYMVFLSTKKPDEGNLMGKIIYWHAYFVIIVLTLTVIVTMAFVGANTIINAMQAHIMIGG